jgi:hypothetical protein
MMTREPTHRALRQVMQRAFAAVCGARPEAGDQKTTISALMP